MNELEEASLRQIQTWLEMCREDLSYALSEIGVVDYRLQGTIEMITRILGDNVKWEAFKKRWNIPWDDENDPNNP